MTIMLRTLGIPAREVNGFLPGEFNDLAGDYIVRASDAHSWVEAYFPGTGWMTFDPTPAATETVRVFVAPRPVHRLDGADVERVGHQLRFRAPGADGADHAAQYAELDGSRRAVVYGARDGRQAEAALVAGPAWQISLLRCRWRLHCCWCCLRYDLVRMADSALRFVFAASRAAKRNARIRNLHRDFMRNCCGCWSGEGSRGGIRRRRWSLRWRWASRAWRRRCGSLRRFTPRRGLAERLATLCGCAGCWSRFGRHARSSDFSLCFSSEDAV